MTSPPAALVSGNETTLHRLVTPTARILAATIIMITGTGIAAIFWKMPNGNEIHALYHEEIINKDLTSTPLPNESMAMLSPEERGQMTLPMLNITPARDDGVGRYTQVYPLPAALAARNSESLEINAASVEEDQPITPVVPHNFAPMRRIVDEKPISVEPVNWEFQPKPVSVSTTEKSDEMLSKFHFAVNSRADSDLSAEPEPPADPFSIASTTPALQPLKPIALDGLSPLHPLPETGLQPLSALVIQ